MSSNSLGLSSTRAEEASSKFCPETERPRSFEFRTGHDLLERDEDVPLPRPRGPARDGGAGAAAGRAQLCGNQPLRRDITTLPKYYFLGRIPSISRLPLDARRGTGVETCRIASASSGLETLISAQVLKRRYKRAEPRKYRKVRKEEAVDPIDEIPDEEWDEILFSVLEQVV